MSSALHQDLLRKTKTVSGLVGYTAPPAEMETDSCSVMSFKAKLTLCRLY